MKPITNYAELVSETLHHLSRSVRISLVHCALLQRPGSAKSSQRRLRRSPSLLLSQTNWPCMISRNALHTMKLDYDKPLLQPRVCVLALFAKDRVRTLWFQGLV